MSNSYGSDYILSTLDKYNIVIYDVENANANKKLLVLDSNKGKVLLQRYYGTSKQLWLAYNVFKTLVGNDVLKVTDWYITSDGAPFVETENKLYYLTKFHDTKLNADNIFIEHAVFLAKWHYLSREIVYARDFADSLAPPRSLLKQIKASKLSGIPGELRKRVLKSLLGVDIDFTPERCLTITLPRFKTQRLIIAGNSTLFQPWQQLFLWNWQVIDLAKLMCIFKYNKLEIIREALDKYNQLNPLTEEEWKVLPSIVMWQLCLVSDYDKVAESYDDLYNIICQIVEEKGIPISYKISLPVGEESALDEELEEYEENDVAGEPDKPPVAAEKVNIIVIDPVVARVQQENIRQEADAAKQEEGPVEPEKLIVEPVEQPVEQAVEADAESQSYNPQPESIQEEADTTADSAPEQEPDTAEPVEDDLNEQSDNQTDQLNISASQDHEIEKIESENEDEPCQETSEKVQLTQLVWKPFPQSPWEK